MATREKTIEFAIPTTATTVADAIVTNLTQITVFIPESAPVFTSVMVEVSWRDLVTVTGGTITEHRVGCRLGAAGYTTITELDDITHSGENMGGVIGPFDFTSHFTANWTGTSMTFDTQVFFDQNTGTTLGMTNVGAKLVVTYEYDDTEATQIKTVRIPLDSNVSTLPTTAANFGTNQIPQLTSGGILPEAGVVIRDYFFLIEGNESNAAVTDWTLNADIGGASAQAFGLTECALQSDVFMRWIYKPAAVPATTSAHNLRLWAATLARANHITVTLYITYEFTLAGTTRILNSLIIPIEIASPIGASTTAEASRFQRDVFCVEPGTLTLRQSGFRINYILAASSNHSWRAGGQAYRTYTGIAGVVCGMFSVQQRIDAGGVQGAGFTLARGRNTITIDGYGSSTTNQLTNVGGVILLNYESDIPASGIGAAAKTLLRTLLQWDAALTDRNRINSWVFPIIPADYWLIATGFCFIQWVATAGQGVTFDVQTLPGESKGAGYLDIYADAYQADAERGCSLVWMRGRDTFKRFPQDADPNRLDIETARAYRLFTSTTCSNGIIAAISYHSMTWAVAGNISGHNASLTTDLALINATTGECMQKQTLSAGTTAFSFTVYDDTETYYVVARQNDSYVGRSGNALPGVPVSFSLVHINKDWIAGGGSPSGQYDFTGKTLGAGKIIVFVVHSDFSEVPTTITSVTIDGQAATLIPNSQANNANYFYIAAYQADVSNASGNIQVITNTGLTSGLGIAWFRATGLTSIDAATAIGSNTGLSPAGWTKNITVNTLADSAVITATHGTGDPLLTVDWIAGVTKAGTDIDTDPGPSKSLLSVGLATGVGAATPFTATLQGSGDIAYRIVLCAIAMR